MKAIAVVVTYNRKELLDECLTAILNQTLPVKKIIVINNASTDGTEKLFENGGKFDIPEVELHTMSKNLGGAGGFYEGVKLTIKEECDWVWIMDDDTIPTSNALFEFEKSVEALHNTKISFLASSVRGLNGEPMNIPTIDEKKDFNGYPNWYSMLEYGMVKIQNATFVSILVSHDAVLKVGLPFKDYFLWGDDIEYTLRLTKYYGDAYMCGTSKVIHKRKNAKALSIIREEDKNRCKLYYYYYRNKLINYKEYHSKIERIENYIKIFAIIFILAFKPKVKYRMVKIKSIIKGVLAYIFKRYDSKAFKNRLYSSKLK